VQHTGLGLRKEAREAVPQQQAHVTSLLTQKGTEEGGVEKRQATAASPLAAGSAAHGAKPGALDAWEALREQLDHMSSLSAPLQKLAAKDVRIRPVEILDLQSLPVPRQLTHSHYGNKYDSREFASAWRTGKHHGMVAVVMQGCDQWLFPEGGSTLPSRRSLPRLLLQHRRSCPPPLLPPRWRLHHPSRNIDLCDLSPVPATTRISRSAYEVALAEEEANDAAAAAAVLISGGGSQPASAVAAGQDIGRLRAIVDAAETRTLLSRRLRAAAKASPFHKTLSEEMRRRNEHLPLAARYAACHRLPHARCVDLILFLLSRGLDSLAAYVLSFSHSPSNILLSVHNLTHSRMEGLLESDAASRAYPDGTRVARAQALAWKGQSMLLAINKIMQQVPEPTTRCQ
jgi:hypothetical protein